MKIQELISNDPNLGIQRIAEVVRFMWLPGERIILDLKICFKDKGEVLPDRFKPYPVTLIADNTTMVNPNTGKTEEDGEDKEDCTIGEYDYLCAIANSNINIFDIMKSTIATADTRGRYNNIKNKPDFIP